MCHSPLANAPPDQPAPCTAGCGEWLATAALVALVGSNAIGRGRDGGGHVACPVCQLPMTTASRAAAYWEQCDDHGIWIIARFHERFREAFAREISATHVGTAAVELITAQLVRLDPDDARALAERIVKLERDIAQLTFATSHIARE